jgi:hypothetical protein
MISNKNRNKCKKSVEFKVKPMDTVTPWKIMASKSDGIRSGLCYRLESRVIAIFAQFLLA